MATHGLRLPAAVVRAVTWLTLRQALAPWVPPPWQRRLVELLSVTLPGRPAGVRAHRTVLGSVPVTCVGDAESGRVVLYLHGGGFVTGSAAAYVPLGGAIAVAGGAAVYLVDYRRAPEHPHPAALDDTLAAYRALLAAGVPADRIVLAGDSAGGYLALAAALRLRADGDPLPAGLALVSPWLDLTGPVPAGYDPLLTPAWLRSCAAAYLAGADRADPSLAPLSADLAGLPPVYVLAGAQELIVGDADRLVARLRAEHLPVEYDRWPGMWHDFPIAMGLLGAAADAVAGLGRRISSWLPEPGPKRGGSPSVTIVGAGFGGIGMAIELVRHGHRDFVILDQADRIGGVWRENTYPGAACDVPSVQYCFSYEQRPDWPRRFSGQADILVYLEQCVDRYDLRGHLRLGVTVTDASRDAATGRWAVRTGAGETLESDVLVFACGQLSRPSYPDIPGLDRFTGTVFHSARWCHEHDLTGRRVAVIGTGSSALQFVPEVAKVAGRLTVFQRTAGWVLPKVDSPLSTRQQRRYRRWPALLSTARHGWDVFEEGLTYGITRHRAALLPLRLVGRTMLRLQVHDPSVRARLRPGIEFGCKRIGFSNDWYPTFNRSTVDLVTSPIETITETGVRTADGALSEVDTIILGTGFAATEFLAPIEVRAGDRSLNDAWRDGARAYLGITVPGFPNMFLMYGPNTNLGSGSIIHMMEGQARYVRQAIEVLGTGRVRELEVRQDVADAYDRRTQRRLAGTVWVRCQNWYRTSDGRVVNNWPGQLREYRRQTDHFDASDYRDA
jgi:cation diffusion facilitator CzcD-associated flavoprotein CzcO/acetyl esterase/lipase